MSVTRQGEARPKFALGRVCATPGALQLLEQCGQSTTAFLARHAHGDWGATHPNDQLANDKAISERLRIISSYVVTPATGTAGGGVIWVLTEADRSSTTILLPGEY